MKAKLVFMFSGQGSQYYHMGEKLFEQNKTFKSIMLAGDEICRKLLNISMLEQIYNPHYTKGSSFSETLISHPAIYMTECALLAVLKEEGIKPDVVLGASMGEFAACVAADVLDFNTGLMTVIKQAQAIQQCPPGGMLAILENPAFYASEAWVHESTELAAINFATHFIVSGDQTAIEKISIALDQQKILSQKLPVVRAFHSTLIDAGEPIFLDSIKRLALNSPTLTFVSCAYADELAVITQQHLWDCARKPILFQKSIQRMESLHPSIFIDLGPTGTLATFVKYNLSPESTSIQLPILSPYGTELKQLRSLFEKL